MESIVPNFEQEHLASLKRNYSRLKQKSVFRNVPLPTTYVLKVLAEVILALNWSVNPSRSFWKMAATNIKVEISPNDKRSYRHLTLGNRLDVLLVHDVETEKSSACVDVRIGSMADPKEMPGLAHFLEHMLFLGTETYPVENAYSSFLSSHGGMSNAYTDQENTVYYFDVQNSAFEEALNMFSSFFTCPLFSEAATGRETNAVDSENEKNLQVPQSSLRF